MKYVPQSFLKQIFFVLLNRLRHALIFFSANLEQLWLSNVDFDIQQTSSGPLIELISQVQSLSSLQASVYGGTAESLSSVGEMQDKGTLAQLGSC